MFEHVTETLGLRHLVPQDTTALAQTHAHGSSQFMTTAWLVVLVSQAAWIKGSLVSLPVYFVRTRSTSV